MAELVRWTRDDVDSRVQSILSDLSPTETQLRDDVATGSACPCRVEAWREIEGLRWMAGEEETT